MAKEATISLQIEIKKLSNKKKKRLNETIEKQGEIAQKVAELMPSISSYRWSQAKTDNVFHRWVDKYFPDNNGLRSHDANQVAYKVADAFDSWKQNGYRGDRPRFRGQSWCRFCNCGGSISYEQNNGEWGVKLPLEPYGPEWFSIGVGEYQSHYLTKVGAGFGDAEVIRRDNRYILNQSITYRVEKDRPTPNELGVDLGLNKIAVYVLLNRDGDYLDSGFFDGKEVRHYREKMRNTRKKLQRANEIKKVKELRDREKRFVEQKNHFISKRIVEEADENNARIILEHLKNIRENINEDEETTKSHRRELNNWAFGELQNMLQYKADLVDVSVKKIGAKNTSRTCPKCNDVSEENRDGIDFECRSCGYSNHSDFVGATNIAKRGKVKG